MSDLQNNAEWKVTTRRIGKKPVWTPPIDLERNLDRLRALLPLGTPQERALMQLVIDRRGKGYDVAYLVDRFQRLLRPDPEFTALVERAELEQPE